MKKFNIILATLLVLCIGLGIYFHIGSALDARLHKVTASAASYPEAYQSIVNVLSAGAAPQQFAETLPAMENCTLMDVSIRLSNKGLFPAEWIDVSLQPAEGDIAVYSLTGATSDIAGLSDGQINLKLITTASPVATRSVDLTYYVFGARRTLHLTF